MLSESREFRERFTPFLLQHGFSDDVEVRLIRGGANNRVYRVEESRRAVVLKHYFQNPNDPRDRFQAERAFYEIIRRAGIRLTPEAIDWDAELRVGLFSFVRGRKLNPDEVDSDKVKQAAKFVAGLNHAKDSTWTGSVPEASEACFSVSEHLACVERRVARLQQIEILSEIDRGAVAFLREELAPAWFRVRDTAQWLADELGLTMNRTLLAEARCVSPSDFGFHNALLASDGQLCFFDFEYAGWDDPAKLICDFFCQPELPVAMQHWDHFTAQVVESCGPSDSLAVRAWLLLPAYQIKWCCIMLNEFVRTDQARRDFAAGETVNRRGMQLDKARRALLSLHKV